MDLKKSAEEYKSELIRIRRHVHMNPELGFLENDTSKFIQNELAKLGLVSYLSHYKNGVSLISIC